jgi:hypothetical protein
MAQERSSIDISAMPDVLRIAEEVRASRRPRRLRRHGEDIAVVAPVEPVARRQASRARGKPTSATDSLWKIVGIARSDGPTDVADNKHHYLADAYLPKPE